MSNETKPVKLNENGSRTKQDVAAIAEMERKIFEFLEQQHPDFLNNSVIYKAIQSVHFKMMNLL